MTNEKTNAEKRPAGMPRIVKIGAFAASFLCAVITWLYAIGYDSTLFEKTFSGVKVELEGQDRLAELSGYTLPLERDFSSITVVARGKQSDLNSLDSNDFRAVVDVSKITSPGEQDVNIIVYSPNGIEVVEQSSTAVRVFVDKFITKDEPLKISVETATDNVYMEGITFVDAVANPPSLVLSGPESQLDTVAKAVVRYTPDVSVIQDDYYGLGAIELQDENGNPVDNPYIKITNTEGKSISTAYVTLKVTKEKQVPVNVVFTGGIYSADDIKCEQTVYSVTLSGSPNVVNTVNAITLEIDETEIENARVYEFNVGELLPEGVSCTDAGTIGVKVTMPVEQSVYKFVIPKDRISIKNFPQGYTYELLNDIEITLVGVREFSDIDDTLIKAVADFNIHTANLDGSRSAEVVIDLGNVYEGLYLLNKDYTVDFNLTKIPDLPGPENGSHGSDGAVLQKEIPIRLNFIAGIYSPSDVSCAMSVQTITVSGSAMALNTIDELVLSIDETTIGRIGSFKFNAAAMLPGGITFVGTEPNVTVTVVLPEEMVYEFDISSDKIKINNLPVGYEYTILGDLTVTLINTAESVVIDSALASATVDYSTAVANADGSYTATALVNLGKDYKGVYLQNTIYKVTFKVTTVTENAN